MSSKFRFISTAAITIALGGFAAVSAQEPTTKDTTVDKEKVEKRERMGRHGGFRGMKGGMHRGMRGPGMMFRGIELTEAQKQQIRAIHDANKPTEAELAQLRAFRDARKAGTELTAEQKGQIKAFREARAAKMRSVHEQVLSVLTPEQKQQIEQRKLEMKARMKERGFRKMDKPAEAKPPVKPNDN